MESTTEETSQALPDRYRRRTAAGSTVDGDKEGKDRSKDDDDDDGECDKEVWNTLSDNFRRVQSVLDQNRVLIQQVNENHQSKIPDNLAKNVTLIQEINANISKVMSMYSDLSVNFSSIVHQRRAIRDSMNNSSDEEEKENSAGS
ncbi:hypothetical protein Vadar_018044 [Vaccinium darrowii]|uniref:Uncharacterized protein n=1 Tax=Vaccinium darrowii TaxID=229202 RepID=A0ACB7ZDE4_9ERIC|nr:hypothetical protein Vadar_018044 [Vaccinium darrowii]